MSQRLGRRFRARGRADYFSDITVQQTYNQNIYDASRRSRIYSGSVTGTVGSWNLSGAFDRNEFFYGTTQSTVRGGTPKISAQRSDKPLFGSPAYFSMAGGGRQLHRPAQDRDHRSSTTGSRASTSSRACACRSRSGSSSRSRPRRRRATPTGPSGSDPANTSLNLADPISRNYYELAVQVSGPTFNRIWNRPGSGYAEKIKHSIEPYFNVQRVSPIDDFDSSCRSTASTSWSARSRASSYGVNNRLFRKPGGGGRSTEMVTVALGQSYYTDARAAQYDKYYQTSNGTAPSKFSPLSLQVRAWPSPRRQRAVPRRVRHQVQRLPVDVGRWHRGGARLAALDVRLEPAPVHRGAVGLRRPGAARSLPELGQSSWKALRNRIGGAYTFNYDIKTGRFLQQRLLNYYNAQCCGFALEYQQYDLSGYNTTLPVQKDQRFNFSITLAGIGSFSNFFGAFGGGGSGSSGTDRS